MMKKKAKIIGVGLTVFCLFFLGTILFHKPDHPDLQIYSLQEWVRFPKAVRVDDLKLKMRVAAAALPVQADKGRCLQNIADTSAEIKRQNPDTRLILFGESALGLYRDPLNGRSYQESAAEPIPGPATERLGGLARTLDVYLAVGLIEKSADRLYNSLVLLSPEGKIVARHRKRCLHEYDVQNGIEEGTEPLSLCDVDGFRVGLSICADANLKSMIRAYRQERMDLLLQASASNLPWFVRRIGYWPPARAYDSWIVSANRFGDEGDENYSGYLFVADRNGALHRRSNGSAGHISALIGK